MNYDLVERLPTVEEFNKLRLSAGWSGLEPKIIAKALEPSLYSVCAVVDNRAVGMGRVIGDGGLYYYIQDLVVDARHQGRGIGKALLGKIMKFLADTVSEGAFIGLMAGKGKKNIYKKVGFIERPNDDFGPGMCIYKTK